MSQENIAYIINSTTEIIIYIYIPMIMNMLNSDARCMWYAIWQKAGIWYREPG